MTASWYEQKKFTTAVLKMKICYDPCFVDVGVVMQRNDAIMFFIFICISRYLEFFLKSRLKKLVPPLVGSIMAKFEQIL